MTAEKICAALWGVPMMAILIAGGFIISAGTGFVQIRHFGKALRQSLASPLGRRAGHDEVSPVEAVCTSLAGTVGTGNIVGVAAAIAVGGPGAVFWMWVSAIIGMGTKYAETYLSVKYSTRNRLGEKRGGPMYYMERGLGAGGKLLAVIFSVCGAAASFGIGNMVQMASILDSAEDAAAVFFPGADVSRIRMLISAAAAITAAYLGGRKKRGKLITFIVPVMAGFYIIGALAVIGANIGRLPQVMVSIFAGAFRPSAAAGGTIGAVISCGLGRGLFSNEAGMGSSPIAHGEAACDDPEYHGFLGMFEVFCDTMVICTLTALMVLCAGTQKDGGGVSCCTAALSTVFGARGASFFMASAMTMFAFSSILGWSVYGERCAEYLFGGAGIYRAVFCSVILLTATTPLSAAITVADILNALMAVPNIAAVLLLMPRLKKEITAGR